MNHHFPVAKEAHPPSFFGEDGLFGLVDDGEFGMHSHAGAWERGGRVDVSFALLLGPTLRRGNANESRALLRAAHRAARGKQKR